MNHPDLPPTRIVPAYYAKYTEGHHGARDRIGGLPSHLPEPYPTCSECGERQALMMQLYVDDKELFQDDWLVLQLYECINRECPLGELRMIALPKDASANTGDEGAIHPDVEPQDISWEKRDDPDPSLYPGDVDVFVDEDGDRPEKYAYLDGDKLGGCFAWYDSNGFTGYQTGAIGQFASPTGACDMIYLLNSPENGLEYYYF